jgi:hypothetical protein
VTFDVGVIRAGHQFGRWMRTTKVGHLFRALIDKQNDQNDLGMIFGHRLGDMMQQGGLAGARRGDNQTALPHSERRHQIHDPSRVTVRHRFELDSFVRIDRGQLFKRCQTLIFGRLFTVDLEQLHQLRAAAPAPGFTVNPHAIAQAETTHNLGSYKNILRRLHEVTLRIAQESKTLARDFDDAFAEFRFGLNLFAPFGTGLRPLAPTRGGPVKGLDLSNRAGRIGIN